MWWTERQKISNDRDYALEPIPGELCEVVIATILSPDGNPSDDDSSDGDSSDDDNSRNAITDLQIRLKGEIARRKAAEKEAIKIQEKFDVQANALLDVEEDLAQTKAFRLLYDEMVEKIATDGCYGKAVKKFLRKAGQVKLW